MPSHCWSEPGSCHGNALRLSALGVLLVLHAAPAQAPMGRGMPGARQCEKGCLILRSSRKQLARHIQAIVLRMDAQATTSDLGCAAVAGSSRQEVNVPYTRKLCQQPCACLQKEHMDCLRNLLPKAGEHRSAKPTHQGFRSKAIKCSTVQTAPL